MRFSITRLNPLLQMTVVLLAGSMLVGSMRAQGVEKTLQWTRESINAHAVTHHLEPPAKISGTKWEFAGIEGCTVELKETAHREAPDSVANSEGVFGLSEDRVITWTFDLGALRPQFVMADTSIGSAHIKIFAEGDAFHLKTDTTSRLLKKDGTIQSSTNWSNTSNARNLMMFFDSPSTDNKVLVRRLENDLRDAVAQCAVQARAR
jgi:hypothetical protein